MRLLSRRVMCMEKTYLVSIFAILVLLAACAPQAAPAMPAAQPAQVVTPAAPAAQPPVPASGPVPEEAPVEAQPPAAAPKTIDVEIKGFQFNPATITINAGDTVRWTNKDSAGHTATADDKTFDTGMLKTGQSGQVTFDKPGTYAYHCAPHPMMKATIVVQ